jgi:hypothetical protein
VAKNVGTQHDSLLAPLVDGPLIGAQQGSSRGGVVEVVRDCVCILVSICKLLKRPNRRLCALQCSCA